MPKPGGFLPEFPLLWQVYPICKPIFWHNSKGGQRRRIILPPICWFKTFIQAEISEEQIERIEMQFHKTSNFTGEGILQWNISKTTRWCGCIWSVSEGTLLFWRRLVEKRVRWRQECKMILTATSITPDSFLCLADDHLWSETSTSIRNIDSISRESCQPTLRRSTPPS